MKPGDKIVCIHSENSDGLLSTGEVYTVIPIPRSHSYISPTHWNDVVFIGTRNDGWRKNRFELVKKENEFDKLYQRLK